MRTNTSLGLDFNLAQDAKGVLAQCRIVRGRLRQPGVELVPERWLSEPADPESSAAGGRRDPSEKRAGAKASDRTLGNHVH